MAAVSPRIDKALFAKRPSPPTRRRGANLGRTRDPAAEAQLVARRAAVAFAVVAVAFLALAVRLYQLQVVEHQHYTTAADDNRMRLQALPPTRGLIFDRRGVLLADNLPAYRLEITAEQVDDLAALLATLGERIPLAPEALERFERIASRTPRHQPVTLVRLEEDEVARLAVDLHRFPGVAIKAGLDRHYPHGPLAAHVVGYVGRIDEDELKTIDTAQYQGSTHIGKNGVERAYEALLHGRVGVQRVETNAQGRILRVLERTPPIPGANLYLTLDVDLQAAASAALGEHNGAVVAIDPRNGEILALVSHPVYDPNPFVNGLSFSAYRALNASRARPLFNRALKGVYPPGSTIKPLVGLAGAEHQIIDPHEAMFCGPFYRLPNSSHRFRDWRRGGHGWTDLSKAIYRSVDVYFYDLAFHLGIDRLHDYLAQFGLGRPTGVDLYGEKAGLLPSRAWKRRVHDKPWYPGETVIAGIGQGYMLTTPLQLAHATATLALDGQPFVPRILKAVQRPGSTVAEAELPRVLPPIPQRNPDHWRHVKTAMEEVVHGPRGTAARIGRGIDYRIAGKTGTAQVFSLGQDEEYNADELAKHLHDHALFVAFAPAEAPRIAVAVVAEHGGGGSRTAAPIARRVLDHYFQGSES
ncbi:MAG: penicillin-binding protein 2 [Candidatus Competibacterales bacterium]